MQQLERTHGNQYSRAYLYPTDRLQNQSNGYVYPVYGTSNRYSYPVYEQITGGYTYPYSDGPPSWNILAMFNKRNIQGNSPRLKYDYNLRGFVLNYDNNLTSSVSGNNRHFFQIDSIHCPVPACK